MEISHAECSNALVVSLIEQGLNARREALHTVKKELTQHLGPHAISAIANYFPPPPSPPPQPPLLRTWLAYGSPPELLERIKRVESEHKQQAAEILQIRTVKQYVMWMWGWASHSPLRDYFGRIIRILECFDKKRYDALQSFRASWKPLSIKLGRDPSATCPPGLSHDDWMLTIQEFQQLEL